MHKFFIHGLALAATMGTLGLQAQLYTPAGAVLSGQSTTNVGIGTPNPAGRLEVVGVDSPNYNTTLLIQNNLIQKIVGEAPTFLTGPQYAFRISSEQEMPIGSPTSNTTFAIDMNGRTSIGNFPITAPDFLSVLGDVGIYSSTNNYMRLRTHQNLGSEILWRTSNNNNLSFRNDNTNNISLRINQQGKIAAGSESFAGDHTFRVKGSTVSETLQVQAEADWAGNSNTVGLSTDQGQHLFWNDPNGFFKFRSGEATPLVLHADGKVGINTNHFPDDHSLYVEGSMLIEEIIVKKRDDWGDFVFEPDYPLMPLSELQNYLAQNKHLPEFPSAADVAENGFALGETQRLLTIKVEELTLYLLQMSKEMEALREEITTLRGEK